MFERVVAFVANTMFSLFQQTEGVRISSLTKNVEEDESFFFNGD